LVTTAEGIRLVQRPIAELAELRGEHQSWRDEVITADSDLLGDSAGETLEIIAEFEIESLEDADRFGLRLRTGEGEFTTIGYALKERRLFVDRMQSGDVDFNAHFPGVHTAEMRPMNGIIRLHIFIDRSSVELFGNDGQVVFTEQIFPAADSLGLELFVDGGQIQLNTLDIYQLEPASFRISGSGEGATESP
jgi:fructan beta-fructosidase